MTARIKVVPDASPNAEGEWIDIPVDMPGRLRWKFMEALVEPFIPVAHHVVAVERGSQNVTSGPRALLASREIKTV